jgi:hypothetical protein
MELTSGRIAALIMGVPVTLSLIGWTGYNVVAAISPGSYPFSYGIPLSNGQVNVGIDAGNLTLRQGGTGGSAEVNGTVHYTLEPPSLAEFPGMNNQPQYNFNCASVPQGTCYSDATLAVPVRTAVTLDTGGGSTLVNAFTGTLTLTTDGGNINTGSLSGNLNLDTGGGNLYASQLDESSTLQHDSGTLQLGTEGGNVAVGAITAPGADIQSGGGNVTISTALDDSKLLQILAEGGNVLASGVTAPDADIDSGGGGITLTFAQVPHNLQLTAEGGDITVVLPAGDARYRIIADTEGGSINAMPQNDPTATNVITVNSGGGDISITEAS